MKKNNTFEDDNRIVADMNFEGAPWYTNKKKLMNGSQQIGQEMSKKETFYLMRNALAAGLAVALVFIFALFVFIMFSLEIWLK